MLSHGWTKRHAGPITYMAEVRHWLVREFIAGRINNKTEDNRIRGLLDTAQLKNAAFSSPAH